MSKSAPKEQTVLFLDIDGVLNNTSTPRNEDNDIHVLDYKKVEMIAKTILATKCKVILIYSNPNRINSGL